MSSYFCRQCKRPLSDPLSISLGIGPVCRINNKITEYKSIQQNMFGSRADYDFDIEEGADSRILWLIDNDGPKSLTNDMEAALKDIQEHGYNLPDYRIMYKDTLGVWDRVLITSFDPIQITFQSLNEEHFAAAKEKLLALKS